MAKDDPAGFNTREVQRVVLKGVGFTQPDQFLAAEQGAPPDPKAIAEQTSAQADLIDAQAKQAKVALDAKTSQADLANDAADRQSKEKIAGLQLQREGMIEAGRQSMESQRQQSEHAHEAGLAAAGAAVDHVKQAADHAHEVRRDVLGAALAPPQAGLTTP
jgi:hypothetical protein